MRVVFIGPPGCGKGTQAKLVCDRMGLAYIGTGDILREEVRLSTPLGKQVEPYQKSGQLVPDTLVNDVVAERFRRPDRPQRFVLDGYPRTVAQAKALDKVLAAQELPLQAVIHFQVDDEEVVKRLVARNRADDLEETVRNRLQIYKDTSPEMLSYYQKRGLVHEIAADGPIETVYKRIAHVLQTPAGA
ncbi:MAG TPA: adenylate kinase [Gemmataceae bacterium]|nr:adenylate kinase [Gemmataceae bacterium]